MSADALYVYAITEESAGADWGTGIDGRVVEPLQEDGLLALVHWMDATPYAGTDEQVRRWAVEHSQVVERAWEAAGTVLPVTFDVLVAPAVDLTAAERLRAWLRANAAMVRARLEAVRGRAELKIELAFDVLAVQPALARDAAVASARTELAGRPPGIRRLLEKKIEVAERAALEARAHDLSTSALRCYPPWRRKRISIVRRSEIRASIRWSLSRCSSRAIGLNRLVLSSARSNRRIRPCASASLGRGRRTALPT